MGQTQVSNGGIQPTILEPIQNLYTGSTIVFTVTVASKDSTHRYNGQGSSNGYKIDGKFAPFIVLTPGITYKFDQADNSNSGHPLRFYKDAAKVTAYTTNVTTNGTAGSSGAYTQIVTGDATPTILYYQCSAHGLMGNAVQTNGLASSVPDDGSITTAKIADNAVTTAKIANNAITGAKMGTGSVGTTQLVDGLITGAKMGNGSVGTNQLVDQAVTLAKLPHGTSSQDGKFLRANNGADPTFESLPASGVTVSNNANNRVVTGDGTNLNAEADVTFDGTELAIADGKGLRTNYIRPKSGTSNTGGSSQAFWKLGEISLNGSEAAEITLYGQEGYSSGNLQYYGKTTIVLRGSNGSTLNGSWWTEGGEAAHYYDVRWKHISGVNYELWVLVGPYNNIMPFVNTTGTFSQSNSGSTGSNSAPSGSTQLQYNSFKLIKNVATIQYTDTHTRFLQNIKLDSGKGIDFSATSNASGMTSELLDEYEEGTFTPTNATIGLQSDYVYGFYQKVGDWVSVQLGVRFSSNSSSVNIYIDGLPFSPTADQFGQYANSFAIGYATGNHIQFALASGAGRIWLYTKNAGNQQSTHFSNDYVRLFGTYKVA